MRFGVSFRAGRATEQIEENYQKLRIAEAAARTERDRLNLIIDSVADPIIVTDQAGGTMLMNAPAEELFWRGWLPRWLQDQDFVKVPLGRYTTFAFLVTALLFASEHGPYWEVGLLAGLAYNWWMWRTRSLGDLVLAHAVTNACLSAYVWATREWQYWM